MDADVVVGAGLAGLVATAELVDAGKRVVVLEQEPEAILGGQAFWSLGGLFMVGTPEQRRLGIRDSHELAWQDWLGSAGFDRDEDHWPRRWAEAYVDFAGGEKRAWLREMGHGSSRSSAGPSAATDALGARQLGAALPPHVGTGPGVVEPFARRVREAVETRGLVTFAFRHRVDELLTRTER